MAARFTISDQVREVLAQATITPTSVKLQGQLDRSLYLEVNKVLAGAGGKWDRKSGTHLFSSDPRELLGLAIDTGNAINKKQLYQAFFTPESLAKRVVELADLKPGMSVLEPSCGAGALIVAARKVEPNLAVTAYEIQADVAAEATRTLFPHAFIHQIDFLTVTPDPIFDRVLMNPPFTQGQDIQHIQHAWGFVRPGGRLVAISSISWRTGKTKAIRAFQKFAAGAYLEEVPGGTFSESGTEVPTLLLRLDKPA